MNHPVVKTRGLTKYYGATRGIEDLDLQVMPGEIFGFLGPNGAGKTTTIRLLLDLVRPTRGEAWILGRPPADPEARARVGYVPGDLVLDGRLTGLQTLDYFAALGRGATPAGLRGRRRALCDNLGLATNDLPRRVRDYSRGTRQKLGLVAAFQHRPELLILDEPTTTLDPLVREAVFGILREAGREGATVFHSSHVLSEVDRTCDRVAIVRDGRLVAVKRIDELRRGSARRMAVRFAAEAPLAALDLPGVEILESRGTEVVLRVSGDPTPLLRVLAGHPIDHLVFPEPSLEEAFLAYYRPGGGAT